MNNTNSQRDEIAEALTSDAIELAQRAPASPTPQPSEVRRATSAGNTRLEEVGEVVRQRVKLEADGVRPEGCTRQSIAVRPGPSP